MAGPCLCTLPLVALALPWTGHVQTRSRGDDSRLDRACRPERRVATGCWRALGGEVHLRSAKRRRRDHREGFLRPHDGDGARRRRIDRSRGISGPLLQALAAFREVARRHGDFAIVACAAVKTSELDFASPSAVSRTSPVARDFPRLDGSALDDALERTSLRTRRA